MNAREDPRVVEAYRKVDVLKQKVRSLIDQDADDEDVTEAEEELVEQIIDSSEILARVELGVAEESWSAARRDREAAERERQRHAHPAPPKGSAPSSELGDRYADSYL